MNIKYLFFLLLLMGIFSPSPRAQTITVLTYNIYHGEDGYNSGKSNLKEIADVINRYHPDFVAVQEVDSMTNRSAALNGGVKQELIQELASLTGMHGYFGRAIDFSDGGYGEGLLSKYAATPAVYSLPHPEGGEGRALIMLVHPFDNGHKIAIAGTHLCHQFEKNRVAQVEKINTIFSAMDLPVLLGGDFNFTPGSVPYKNITEKMDDAALKYGNPRPTYPSDLPRKRIDYFFISKDAPWRIKEVRVLDAAASDHAPVLVTLEYINQ